MDTALQYGVLYSWPNITPLIAGVPFIGIKSIMFGKTRDYKNHWGVGTQPFGRGSSKVEYNKGSLEIVLEDWKRIIAASPNGDPTLLLPFEIRLPFTPSINSPVLPTIDVVQNVQFLDDGAQYKEGDTVFFQTVNFIYAGQSR
jgi:hypothetical protein